MKWTETIRLHVAGLKSVAVTFEMVVEGRSVPAAVIQLLQPTLAGEAATHPTLDQLRAALQQATRTNRRLVLTRMGLPRSLTQEALLAFLRPMVELQQAESLSEVLE